MELSWRGFVAGAAFMAACAEPTNQIEGSLGTNTFGADKSYSVRSQMIDPDGQVRGGFQTVILSADYPGCEQIQTAGMAKSLSTGVALHIFRRTGAEGQVLVPGRYTVRAPRFRVGGKMELEQGGGAMAMAFLRNNQCVNEVAPVGGPHDLSQFANTGLVIVEEVVTEGGGIALKGHFRLTFKDGTLTGEFNSNPCESVLVNLIPDKCDGTRPIGGVSVVGGCTTASSGCASGKICNVKNGVCEAPQACGGGDPCITNQGGVCVSNSCKQPCGDFSNPPNIPCPDTTTCQGTTVKTCQ